MITAGDNAAAGLRALIEQDPDLVILDGDLPGHCAVQTVREIRAISTVPLIMLASRADEAGMVRGLDSGADAYLVKPFGLLVLIARTKALLRRARPSYGGPGVDFASGDLTMDFQRRTATVRGVPARLTPTEYKVLHHLVRNAGRTASRESLEHLLWAEGQVPVGDHLKVFICRLRAKIETPNGRRLIVTERGRGYRFVGAESVRQPSTNSRLSSA